MIEMESSNKTQLFDKHACGDFSRYWYPKPSNSWRWNTGASYSVWTSEIYEFGKYTREYGFYPKQWNLLVFTDNSGPPVIETFNRFKLNHDALATLLNNPELVRRYKKETQKRFRSLYSPLNQYWRALSGQWKFYFESCHENRFFRKFKFRGIYHPSEELSKEYPIESWIYIYRQRVFPENTSPGFTCHIQSSMKEALSATAIRNCPPFLICNKHK